MANRLDFRVMVSLLGDEKFDTLAQKIEALNQLSKQRGTIASEARMQMKLNTAEARMSLNVNRQILDNDKGRLRAMIATQTHSEVEARLVAEKTDALRMETLQRMANGRGIANEREQLMAKTILDEIEEKNRAIRLRQLQMERRERLATTMAIFGMTMSLWQMTNALSAVTKGNEELNETVQQYQAIIMGTTGPMLFYLGIQQLMLANQSKLTAATMIAIPAMTSLFFIYKAMTTESKNLQLLFGALAGITALLTAKAIAHAAAKWAEFAAITAVKGILTFGAALALAAVVGAGAVAIARKGMAASTAQTMPHQIREIEQTGWILAHSGERIGRTGIGEVSPAREGFGGRGGMMRVIVNLDGRKISEGIQRVREIDTFGGVT